MSTSQLVSITIIDEVFSDRRLSRSAAKPRSQTGGAKRKKRAIADLDDENEVNRSSPLSDTAAEALVNMTMETSPEPVKLNTQC